MDEADLRMLNPFSVVPTAYLVEAAGRSWAWASPATPFQAAPAKPARPSALAAVSVSDSSRIKRHGSRSDGQLEVSELIRSRIPVTTLTALAHAWYHDRLDPDWRPHTRVQNQEILDSLGLTGDFWRLPG